MKKLLLAAGMLVLSANLAFADVGPSFGCCCGPSAILAIGLALAVFYARSR